MSKTILQVPIDKKLRDEAAAAVQSQGFSSLQEAVRVFLTGIAEGIHRVTFEPKPVQLSKRAIARYDKITREIEEGKAKLKSFSSIKDLMDDLNA